MRLKRREAPGSTPAGVGDLVARIVAPQADDASRSRVVAALGTALAASARSAGTVAVASGRWLADLAVDIAPRIPVRDAATLSAHHHGLTGLDLAAALVTSSARTTAALGAGVGAVISAEWAAPPTLLTAPALIAAETLAQLAIEVKLVAELHEALGQAPEGPGSRRMLGYLVAWARQRGVDLSTVAGLKGGLPTALTGAAKRELRTRLVRRVAKGSIGIAPIAGALAGGVLNQRETRKLGEQVLADLARRPQAAPRRALRG